MKRLALALFATFALATSSAHAIEYTRVQADRLEYTQDDALAWEGHAWIGRDRGRLWLRSEGERAHGTTEASPRLVTVSATAR